jgi:hypothetical protein
MEDWAKWFEQTGEWSNTTQLYRAVMAAPILGSGPTLMHGVSATEEHIARLNRAMKLVMEANPRNRQYVRAAQLCAIFGSLKVAEMMRKEQSTIRRWRQKGEAMITRRLENDGTN